MSATAQLIESYYKAFNNKAFDDMLSMLSEDVIHDTNQGDRTEGIESFRSFLKDMDTFYEENLTNIEIMVNGRGDRAAAEFICNGTYKTSAEGLPAAKGQKYTLPVGCFFEIENGKIKRVTNYYNLNDWINQVR